MLWPFPSAEAPTVNNKRMWDIVLKRGTREYSPAKTLGWESRNSETQKAVPLGSIIKGGAEIGFAKFSGKVLRTGGS